MMTAVLLYTVHRTQAVLIFYCTVLVHMLMQFARVQYILCCDLVLYSYTFAVTVCSLQYSYICFFLLLLKNIYFCSYVQFDHLLYKLVCTLKNSQDRFCIRQGWKVVSDLKYRDPRPLTIQGHIPIPPPHLHPTSPPS